MCYERVMRAFLSAALLILPLCGALGACSAPAQTGTAVTPTTTPEPTPTPSEIVPANEAFGVDCAGGKACAAGLSCTTYYGIAGPQGPSFHSCEIACGPDKPKCPGTTTCITIADGPGMVCRPKEG